VGRWPSRLVRAALCCYPARWRERHGDEATELAELLIRDGSSAGSVAWSYLAGAAREWVLAGTGRRLRVALGALAAAGSLSVSMLLFAAAGQASAASAVRIVITRPGHAVAQLQTLLREHHFDVSVREEPVPPRLVGTIVKVGVPRLTVSGQPIVRLITGPCRGGGRGCTDGIALSAYFTGQGYLVVGRAARPCRKSRARPGMVTGDGDERC
jgi:hypothetical protein